MNKKTDVLVIGGGPAGVVSAITARRYYPSKHIVVMRDIQEGVIPCGIPYMFASLNDPEDNRLAMTSLERNNVDMVIDRAVSINRKEKYVETEKKDKYSYEKLVIAVGSKPIILPIKGIEKEGVYKIKKDMVYLKQVIKEVKDCKNILVIGGGFIGVEFADELAKLKDKNVKLIEALPRILAHSFDEEFSSIAESKLKESGVDVLTGVTVEEIIGEKKAEKVRVSDGNEYPVDAVILGVGSLPDIELVKNAGLEIGHCKGALVDEYTRTTLDSDIFVIGDCSCKRDFYTRKAIPVMLASTATAEARIAGANLYQIKVVRENKGTIAIYSTYINGLVLGSAGLTEQSARKEGFEIIVGSVDGVDKHPASLPGTVHGKLKLIFSKQSGIILGGQVSCGMSCAQLINVIGIIIQQRMSFTELETLQFATHPYLTSAPTMYPIILAAQQAYSKL